MIFGGYICRKFDNDDLVILLATIAITIFYVGRHQRVGYKVILSVIVVVELVLIGLLSVGFTRYWSLLDLSAPEFGLC